MFMNGAKTTLALSVVTVALGLVFGVILALLRLSKFEPLHFLSKGKFAKIWPLYKIAHFNPLSFLSLAYVEFMRGTPMMVQIFFIFYALPQLGLRIPQIPNLPFDFPRYASGVLAMSLNSGAYVAEIIRAGIQAVPKGQMEAARSLGMSAGQAMRYTILPQAFRNILPALGNEFVTVIKESSIVMIIGISELMFNTSQTYSSSFRYFESLIVCALVYFVMTFTTSRILAVIERRMARGKQRKDD